MGDGRALIRAAPHTLRHLGNQRELIERGLVDGTHLVEHEQTCQQDGQAEDLSAVLSCLP